MRGQQALQLSEARFRNLIETMTDTLIIVDKAGLVQFINPAGELLFRTRSENFLGHPFGFPVVENEVVEIALFTGHEDPVMAEMRAVETQWEGMPAWLASIRDITPQKKREASLEKAGKDLTQFIVQLEASNKRILDNQKSLIEEERLKVLLQMAGSTAHEMNQPLTVLLGNIGLLESVKEDPEAQRECLNEIRDAGVKIAKIVEKVKNIRKYETKPYVAGQFIIDLEQTIKILSIEDADDDFEVIRSALEDSPGITLMRARNIDSAMEKLAQESFDLVLLDHILPDGNSFTFSEVLHINHMDVPVIIITGQEDEVIASRLLCEGAYDYIPKIRFTNEALLRSIGNTLEKVRLKREITNMYEKMQEMTIEDKLTGLYNRRYFHIMLEKEIIRDRRYGHKLVLCLMDLDHFKQINDTYGHVAGDTVLMEVGKILRESFRENDIACRYGGEEFAVLLPNLGLEKGRLVCDRLREKMAEVKFRGQFSDFQVTISIGIAEYNSSKDQAPEGLIRRADQALYNAKLTGGNRVFLKGTD